MEILIDILIGFIAAQHLYFFYFETFAWTTTGRKIFRKRPEEFFNQTKSLAANQGIYNAFLAAGLIWTFFIDDAAWSQNIALFFLGFVSIAGIFGAFTASRMIFYFQGVPGVGHLDTYLVNLMKVFVEYIFLPQFRIFGALIILFAIPGFYALQIPWLLRILLWILSIAIGMFLLFGSQRLEIDPHDKRYRSLISVLNIFNTGNWKTYYKLENLFIKRSRESQRMGLGPIERTYSSMVYDAYLKIKSDEKLFLGSSKSKQRLLQKVAPLKTYLDIELIDYSKDQ